MRGIPASGSLLEDASRHLLPQGEKENGRIIRVPGLDPGINQRISMRRNSADDGLWQRA